MSLQLPAPAQGEQLGSDPAQGFVIFGTQMIAARFMSELMDQQAHDGFGDPVLELIRAEPEFVEDQLTAWAV